MKKMYEYVTNDSYKNSRAYRRKAKKMSEQFGLSVEQVNKIVAKRFEQKHPKFFEEHPTAAPPFHKNSDWSY